MQNASRDQSDKILIVGGGAWGLSISLELIRGGYQNVTVLDPFAIPSPISAANDVNKIVETPLRSDKNNADAASAYDMSLAMAADSWQNDPIYRTFYHPTGLILASSSPKALEGLQEGESYDSSSEYNKLESPEDFKATMRVGVLTGDFPNWIGWHRPSGAGWCHARKVLEAVHKEALRLGVNFVTGEAGDVSHLLFENSSVVGVECKNGLKYPADLVILAAGAYSNEIFDFQGQLRPTAWTLGHIKMQPEELQLYKNLPVLFNNELGFFMEPDEDRGELKICDEHPGYCNWIPTHQLPAQRQGGPAATACRSIPFARQGIPHDSETRIRKFLKETMPHLADRPLCFGRICWDVDTPDRNFLIDRVPEFKSSLIVASGGSGNGVQNMPAIGKIVKAILEGTVDPVLQKGFGWRPGTAKNRDFTDTQGRFGADNTVMNLQEVTNWVDLEQSA